MFMRHLIPYLGLIIITSQIICISAQDKSMDDLIAIIKIKIEIQTIFNETYKIKQTILNFCNGNYTNYNECTPHLLLILFENDAIIFSQNYEKYDQIGQKVADDLKYNNPLNRILMANPIKIRKKWFNIREEILTNITKKKEERI